MHLFGHAFKMSLYIEAILLDCDAHSGIDDMQSVGFTIHGSTLLILQMDRLHLVIYIGWY